MNMKKLTLALVAAGLVSSNVFAATAEPQKIIAGKAIPAEQEVLVGGNKKKVQVFDDDVFLTLSNNVYGSYSVNTMKQDGVIVGSCHVAGSTKTAKSQKCSIVGIRSAAPGTGTKTVDAIAVTNGEKCATGSGTKTVEKFVLSGPRVFVGSTNGGSVAPSARGNSGTSAGCADTSPGNVIKEIWK